MGLNLSNKVSADDLQNMDSTRNPPEYESGFEPNGGNEMSDAEFESMFDSSDDEFGDLFGDSGGSSDPFASSSNDPFASSGNNPFASSGNDPFASSSNDPFASSSGNVFGGSIYGSNIQQNQNQNTGKFDGVVNGGLELVKDTWSILVELVQSVKTRSVDDFGYLGRNIIIYGGMFLPIGLVTGIIGTLAGLSVISFKGLGFTLTFAGGFMLGIGTIMMGSAAFLLERFGGGENNDVSDIPDVGNTVNDDATNDLEDNIDAVYDDLFGDDFDALFENESDDTSDSNEENDSYFDMDEEDELDISDGDDSMSIDSSFDFDSNLDNVKDNQVLSRETLFNTFKQLLPVVTPDFANKTEIYNGSDEFRNLEAICMKAMAYVINVENFMEINSKLENAYKTLFVYELRMKRIPKIKSNNIDALATEIENYIRDNANDVSKQVSISIEGDFYKILITTGDSAVVSMGDIFKNEEYCNFFKNTKNKLPMITGINDLGEVICEDAKIFDTMLIAGRPRSGKSWYVLSILASMMLFNTPEDVMFIIVDPKESVMFKTLALMPHVVGLHTDKKILQIMDEIIDVEAPRRISLLEENKVDDIWALRDKGVKLPILYLVIDEYITVKNNLGDAATELDAKLQNMISRLPYVGIRLIFVPHRATGVVNKTNRTMLQYTACVRGDTDDINDTLGIKNWKRPLVKPGDIAVKNSSSQQAIFVRGSALTNTDSNNTKFIEMAAKAFYKMGVDIPDMSHMTLCCTRDNEYIQQQLYDNGNRVQFGASRVFND